MLGFKALRRQRISREVPQIERHDHVGPCLDRRRQHVSVIHVWQRHPGHQRLLA